ncbi:MAG: hypothetical protein IPK22_15895 [Verrucomicrobiaceae bacterium]|nr:hypothetical protein [Verrucomicrobiaceae bacterium]
MLTLFVFALVPLIALLNDGSFGKNVERGKYGLGILRAVMPEGFSPPVMRVAKDKDLTVWTRYR